MDFEQPYNQHSFVGFLSAFLPDDFEKTEENIKLTDLSFNPDRIKNVKLIGSVSSLENLCIYEIYHESENDPRVTLSRETFRLMSNYGVKRALAAFISRNSPNYRFSLATIDLELEGSRVKKEYSNPRRYSFYLGPDAKVHTPTEFLVKKGKIKDLQDLQDRFSVEVVTEAFFAELSNWYFWALKYVIFPKAAEKKENGKNMSVIRLITRLIFIWFMKQKELIPDYLFNEHEMNNILKDISPDESTYYRAILQNLFFASLNTPQNERSFRTEKRFYKGYNPDFGDSSVYRYQSYFRKPKNIIDCLKEIPFLNGGLFECLDRKKGNIYIDGFTDIQKNQPIVPNFLFFAEEREVDLNREYGTKADRFRVRGLLELLQLYNFTIDESTPIDVEIALDPELLGRVFENLLASYNPETATTARKATGSYYTPRTIVDYMVTQSLKEYLTTHLVNVTDIHSKIDNLLSYDSDENPFNVEETNTLIHLINKLKIIDPTVGSGAFPMGILHKLVLVLSKLDPHNEKWKQQQIEAIEKNITDTTLKKELIERVELNFQKNELDYGRKLYLIQNCIYGVDIQPIATQIAKLRFFISLLVDENVNKSQNNYGIEPLPNLETKFVSANSLIGLETQELRHQNVIDSENKLKKVRDKYFSTSNTKQKEKLRKEDAEIRGKIGLFLKQSGFPAKNSEKIVNWDPYDSNKFADWFDPEWMFGIKDKFDIVIANPPYIDSEGMVNFGLEELRQYISSTYFLTKGNWDIYIAFFEKGFNLLSTTGILIYITPDKWISKPFGNEIRKKTIDNIYSILKAGRKIFKSTKVDSIVSIFKSNHCERLKMFDFENSRIIFKKEINKNILTSPFALDFLFSDNIELLLKIESTTRRLFNSFSCENACATSDAYKLKPLITESTKRRSNKNTQLKIINTGTIGKYVSKWGSREMTYLKHKYLCPIVNRHEFFNTFKNTYAKKSTKYKIIIKGLTLLEACLDFEGSIIPGKSTLIIANDDINKLKFILSIINSKLASFYIKEKHPASSYNEGITFTKNMINNLPVPATSPISKKPFIELVDEILLITKDDDYQESPNKQTEVREYEQQIDQLVYKLYGLTDEEIKIVEGAAK